MKFFNKFLLSTLCLLGSFCNIFSAEMGDAKVEALPPRDFRKDPIELRIVTQLTGPEVQKLVGTYEEDVKDSYHDRWRYGVLHLALGNYTIEHGFNSYYWKYSNPYPYKREVFNIVTIRRRVDKPYYRFVSSETISNMPEGYKPELGIVQNDSILLEMIPGYVFSGLPTPTNRSHVASPIVSSGYNTPTAGGDHSAPVPFSKVRFAGVTSGELRPSASRADAQMVESLQNTTGTMVPSQQDGHNAAKVFTFKNATKAAAATVIIGAACYGIHTYTKQNLNFIEFIKAMVPGRASFLGATHNASTLLNGITKSLSGSLEKSMSLIRSYF